MSFYAERRETGGDRFERIHYSHRNRLRCQCATLSEKGDKDVWVLSGSDIKASTQLSLAPNKDGSILQFFGGGGNVFLVYNPHESVGYSVRSGRR